MGVVSPLLTSSCSKWLKDLLALWCTKREQSMKSPKGAGQQFLFATKVKLLVAIDMLIANHAQPSTLGRNTTSRNVLNVKKKHQLNL